MDRADEQGVDAIALETEVARNLKFVGAAERLRGRAAEGCAVARRGAEPQLRGHEIIDTPGMIGWASTPGRLG
jgi:hypothetical protein